MQSLIAMQLDAQLRRLERVLTEKDSTVPYCQHEKPKLGKKAAKLAKKEAGPVTATAYEEVVAKRKKKKAKKQKGAKGKLAGAVAKPKPKKNKDKYNKKKLAGKPKF